MNDHLDNLTILILTHNRYAYLRRLLTYYKQYRELKLIVLDSSQDTAIITELADLLNAPNIAWLRFPGDMYISEKIARGADKVTTEFAVICADDDFIIPQGANKCVEFLLQHADYVAAQGRCLGFSYRYNAAKNRYIYKSGVSRLESKSITGNQASCRFEEFMPNNYGSYPYYAVHRSAEFKKIWQATAEATEAWGWSEIFPSCLSMILGKLKQLPIAYQMRETNFTTWLDYDKFIQLYTEARNNKAINKLSELLAAQDSLPYEQAHSVIWARLNGYVTTAREEFRLQKLGMALDHKQNNRLHKLIHKIFFAIKYRLIRLAWQIDLYKFSLAMYCWFRAKRVIIRQRVNADVLTQTRAEYKTS